MAEPVQDFAREVAHLLHVGREWIQEMILWVVLALAGGVLGAMKRGHTGVRAWAGSLLRSTIVGVVAGSIISARDMDPGWAAATIIFIAFGADAIISLADAAWKWASSNPRGVARALYEWLVNRRIVIERREYDPEHEEANKEDVRRDDEAR